MTPATDNDTRAATLRHALVDSLLLRPDGITSPDVERAMRAVPRHLFAPEVDLETAYADDVIRTRFDATGEATSSISAPWLQAMMLQHARIEPGMNCLEVGSGGYNAALMAELAGPNGTVTTVDIDGEVTARARRFLDAAGYPHVRVLTTDATDGIPEHAPYDAILVTVGLWEPAPAWTAQLADTGRIVVPLRLFGLHRTACLTRHDDSLVSTAHFMAGFVNGQGGLTRPDSRVPLHHPNVHLRADTQQQTDLLDVPALRHALAAGDRASGWSGVTVASMEPFDELLLWLGSVLDPPYQVCRPRDDDAAKAALDSATLTTPALIDGDSIAYLTCRKTGDETWELGAHGHGPDAATLAHEVCAQTRAWHQRHRGGPQATITVLPADTPAEQLPPGPVVARRHTTVVLTWPT